MEERIKLGDRIKDAVTGYEGIATTRTKFLNGCVQYSIAPKLKKGEKYPFEGADISIDEQNLIVVKKNVVNSCEYPGKEVVRKKPKPKPKSVGGPTRLMKRQRGY